MKKLLVLFMIMITNSFAALSIEEKIWESGDTFLQFLQRNQIPTALYYTLDKEEQELASEIAYKIKYQILKNDDGKIEQALIPISDELMIHIYKNEKNAYNISFTPTIYDKETRFLNIKITGSVYQDIYDATKSSTLARAMLRAYKDKINFRNVQKGDSVMLYYEQKRRLGKLWGDITIKMARVDINKKPMELFLFNDHYYDRSGKDLETFLLTTPMNSYKRISSHFTTARFHPVLKKYRAHLGTDYAAPTGTPVYSAGDGTITFVGSQNGYGNVVKIKHASGFTTLYAHLSRFGKIKKGQKIKQGQLIAYVGSTGMSTGPHLHFGVYANNKAINPLSAIKVAKTQLSIKNQKIFKSNVAKLDTTISDLLANTQVNPPKEEDFEWYIEF